MALSMSPSTSHRLRSKVRAVPCSSTRGWITFEVRPLDRAKGNGQCAPGVDRAPQHPGNSCTRRAASAMRSTVWWGRAVWPPGPSSTIVNLSALAVIGPTRLPTLPVSSDGSTWKATIPFRPSTSPSSTYWEAPPGNVSSAGWNSNLTPTGNSSWRERRRCRRRWRRVHRDHRRASSPGSANGGVSSGS